MLHLYKTETQRGEGALDYCLLGFLLFFFVLNFISDLLVIFLCFLSEHYYLLTVSVRGIEGVLLIFA